MGNIVSAQEQLGHVDPATTIEFYATYADANLVRVVHNTDSIPKEDA